MGLLDEINRERERRNSPAEEAKPTPEPVLAGRVASYLRECGSIAQAARRIPVEFRTQFLYGLSDLGYSSKIVDYSAFKPGLVYGDSREQDLNDAERIKTEALLDALGLYSSKSLDPSVSFFGEVKLEETVTHGPFGLFKKQVPIVEPPLASIGINLHKTEVQSYSGGVSSTRRDVFIRIYDTGRALVTADKLQESAQVGNLSAMDDLLGKAIKSPITKVTKRSIFRGDFG